jgi:hypothetical protein
MPTDDINWNKLTLEARNEILEGALAARHIKQTEDYARWAQVGRALARLKIEAMHLAGANSPYGRHYTAMYRALADQVHDLIELDNASKAHAVWLAENFEAVERWRQTLATNVRIRLNHPTVVKRRYEAATVVPKEKAAVPKPGLKDEVIRLQGELDAANIRANAGPDRGDPFTWTEGPKTIARVLVDEGLRHSSARKVREVLKAALVELDRIEKKAAA